jgi:exoribonuclease-2
MERYWCLRWLQQEGVNSIAATVRREQLVKLDHLPLLLRVPSLPPGLLPGARVQLAVEAIDLLAPEVSCRFSELLAAGSADAATFADELDDSNAESDADNAATSEGDEADGAGATPGAAPTEESAA